MRMMLVGLGACVLAGCTVRDDAANNGQAAAPAAESTGVVRQDVAAPQPAVQLATPAAAIQSQPGPGGGQVDLLKLAVTGDILTATFRCASTEKHNYESFDVSKMSMIDDATAQRIAVLKDNGGNWLASDPNGSINLPCGTEPGIFWIKFPAPPVTSATVSLNLPQTAPFDGVPVMR